MTVAKLELIEQSADLGRPPLLLDQDRSGFLPASSLCITLGRLNGPIPATHSFFYKDEINTVLRIGGNQRLQRHKKDFRETGELN